LIAGISARPNFSSDFVSAARCESSKLRGFFGFGSKSFTRRCAVRQKSLRGCLPLCLCFIFLFWFIFLKRAESASVRDGVNRPANEWLYDVWREGQMVCAKFFQKEKGVLSTRQQTSKLMLYCWNVFRAPLVPLLSRAFPCNDISVPTNRPTG
jgi:hypothetical protein